MTMLVVQLSRCFKITDAERSTLCSLVNCVFAIFFKHMAVLRALPSKFSKQQDNAMLHEFVSCTCSSSTELLRNSETVFIAPKYDWLSALNRFLKLREVLIIFHGLHLMLHMMKGVGLLPQLCHCYHDLKIIKTHQP